MTDAYPLTWPPGWRRTPNHQIRPARFGTSFAKARDSLLNELRLLGARSIVISSNITLRRDGLPYANTPQPVDRGVAVYFDREGKQQCIPCDKWARIEDNIHAVNLTVAALRGLDRWGAKDMVDAAFRGFQALPAPDGSPMIGRAPWYDILGVEPTSTKDEIRRRYLELAKETHPDLGGSVTTFQTIKEAYEEGLRR